jgi:membrane protein DedA with SNARE-associated domain
VNGFAAFIHDYGWAAVFFCSFLENAGVPFPAFPVIVLAGAYASTGLVNLPMVVAGAVLGALLADTAWYYVGVWRGKGVLSILCRISFNPDACLERAVDGFHRRKAATILFAKFLPGVNTIMPPLAGVAAMPIAGFLALDLGGALLWSGAGAGLGWLFGSEIAEAAKGIHGMMGWLAAGAIAATLAWRACYRYYLVRRFSVPRVDPEELHRMMSEEQGVMVLDLRRDDEYAASDRMVAGAVRVRPGSFHRRAHHLPRDRHLVFYCS